MSASQSTAAQGQASEQLSPGWAELGLLLVVLIWGVNFSVMKATMGDLDPLVFNAIRLTLSAVFLALWAAWDHRSSRGVRVAAPLRPSLLLQLVGLGLIGHFAYQTSFILGLERTSAGNSALIISSSPLWTALMAQAIGLERLGKGAWFGLALAFVGTACITFFNPSVEVNAAVRSGDLLTMLAAFLWGIYTALTKPMLQHFRALGLVWKSTAVALPALWLLAWPRMEAGTIASLTTAQWGAVAFSGLLSTGLAYALWNIAIKHVGASQTAIFTNLVPIVALAVGVLWLGEPVHAAQVAGGALVLVGVARVRRGAKDK